MCKCTRSWGTDGYRQECHNLDITVRGSSLGTNHNHPQRYRPPHCSTSLYWLALHMSRPSQQFAITTSLMKRCCCCNGEIGSANSHRSWKLREPQCCKHHWQEITDTNVITTVTSSHNLQISGTKLLKSLNSDSGMNDTHIQLYNWCFYSITTIQNVLNIPLYFRWF
jgi:hypothetical protein